MNISPDLGTLGVQVLNFFVLFSLLKWKLFGPVISILEEREKKIKSDLDRAEEARKEALELKKSYDDLLKDADKKSQEIIQEAVTKGEKVKSDLLEKGRHEVEKMKKEGQEQIRIEKEKAASELSKEISGFSVRIASKLLQKNIDEESNRKLIMDFVKEMEA